MQGGQDRAHEQQQGPILPQQTDLYHGTDRHSARSIRREGIQPPPGGPMYGGQGELGRGFYTTTDASTAALYADGRVQHQNLSPEQRRVLHLQTKGDYPVGQLNPPPGFDWQAAGRSKELERAQKDHRVLANREEKPTRQYAFPYPTAPKSLGREGTYRPAPGGRHQLDGEGWETSTSNGNGSNGNRSNGNRSNGNDSNSNRSNGNRHSSRRSGDGGNQ